LNLEEDIENDTLVKLPYQKRMSNELQATIKEKYELAFLPT
jgi:hypothetical protein